MDEQLFEKIKQGANKVFTEAEKFTGNAVDKTGNLISKTKINYAISSDEKKIKDILSQIGKIVYDEYKEGNDFPENIAEKLSAVDMLYDEISEMKEKIAELDESVVCPACGEYCKADSEYCPKCGVKLN